MRSPLALGVPVPLALILVALAAGCRSARETQPPPAGGPETATNSSPAEAPAVRRPKRPGRLRVQGVPLRAPSDLRLLVADSPAPFILDVDRGTTEPITGLPTSGKRGVVVLPLGNDALVLSSRYCKSCPPVSDVYLVRHGSMAAIPLGAAWQVVPRRDGQGMWTLSRRAGGGCAIRELGLEFRPRRAPVRVSCRTGLVAELPAGLLVESVGPLGVDPHNALLEPDGTLLRLSYDQAQPVVGNLVLTGADRRTPLVLHDVASGVTHRLSWPSGRRFSLRQATGEPGGRLAAVDFATYSPEHRYDLWLLATASRRWHHLPGMPARLVPKVTYVRWTGDGRAVIMSENLLAVWRPGEPRLAVSRVRRPKQAASGFVIW
jgi:hypothetical protein